MRMTTLDYPSRDMGNISLMPVSNISSSLASHFNKTMQFRSANSGGLSTVKSATQFSSIHDGNLQSVRAIQSYQKHMERQTAKFERQIEAEETQKRRPGSGNLWQNRLTRPTSPKLRSLERSRLKNYTKNKQCFLSSDGLKKRDASNSAGRSNSQGRNNSLNKTGPVLFPSQLTMIKESP